MGKIDVKIGRMKVDTVSYTTDREIIKLRYTEGDIMPFTPEGGLIMTLYHLVKHHGFTSEEALREVGMRLEWEITIGKPEEGE